MTDRVWRLNGEVLPSEWGQPYGLRMLPANGESRGIAALIDKRSTSLTAKLAELDRERLDRFVFDHSRTFGKVGGSATAVAVVTAPYLAATLGHFGSAEAANARIHEIAVDLGLAVRVGHPADTIYLSNRDNDPTLPIVWWQPSRIQLPFPVISDPNPLYESRMER